MLTIPRLPITQKLLPTSQVLHEKNSQMLEFFEAAFHRNDYCVEKYRFWRQNPPIRIPNIEKKCTCWRLI